jgi:hypothetical protein
VHAVHEEAAEEFAKEPVGQTAQEVLPDWLAKEFVD